MTELTSSSMTVFKNRSISPKNSVLSGVFGRFMRQYGHKTLSLVMMVLVMFALWASPVWASSTPEDEGVWVDNEPRIVLSANKNVMIPTDRPHPSVMIPLAPAGMVLPELRPDRRSLYPKTTITLDEFFTTELGVEPNQSSQPYKLKSGEGLATMLKRSGMTANEAQNVIAIIGQHRSLRRLPIGFRVDVIPPLSKGNDSDKTPIGAPMGAIRLALEDDYDLTIYQTAEGEWKSQISTRPIERFLTFVNGTIESSLYKAGVKAGMSDNVFNTFVQVLSFSVDFQREIQKGDKFEALFETKRDLVTGKTKFGTDLYYLSMTLSGDKIEYFKHVHADGTVAWYDDAGNSASRTLMRTPINGARLSSGYGKRVHPVLGYSKMHRGSDFAARTGTPIMAAGSGVVEYSGWNGSYGKYIRIRHNSTYKTAYAHMSAIKRGVTPGARVKQGQVIGFVGSTGRSTGPHLHYEILLNNRKVNPMTVRLPAGKSIPDAERAPFEISLATIESELVSRGVVRFASE